MSLVPTFVAAVDGNYYKNPILYGDYGAYWWFLCWDDDEPVELVISNVTVKHAATVGTLILQSQNIAFNNLRKAATASRLFPQTRWKRAKKAVSLYVDLMNPIPIPQLHDGLWDGKSECVIYTYGLESPKWT